MKVISAVIILLVSICANGQTTFQKVINVDNGRDFPWSIQILDDGYLICAAGFSQALNEWVAIRLYKTNFNGNLIWSKDYGKVGFGYYPGNNGSFIKTTDTGFALGGSISNSITNDSDPILFKFDTNGDSSWIKSYGGSQFDAFRHCRQTSDGGFILEGETLSKGDLDGDFYLVKTDSLGNLEWEKTYGGIKRDRAVSLEITKDMGFILSGPTASYGQGSSAAYVVKTDSTGILEWDTTFGTTGEDLATAITTARDGGFLVWGGLDTTINTDDFKRAEYVGKLDSKGKVVWWRFFNGEFSRQIWFLRELDDGSIIFIGERRHGPTFIDSGWMVKLSSQGNLIWERLFQYDQDSINYDKTMSLRGDFQQTDDGGFIIVGNAWNLAKGNIQEILLMKVDSNGCLENDCGLPVSVVEPKLPKTNISLYPNPTSHDLVIEFEIDEEVGRVYFDLYDLAGVRKKAMIFDKHQVRTTINVYDLPTGFYLYTFRSQKGMLHSGKISVQRH